ncbi:MAG TPA: HAMP domain-containing histidine kinase [Deltaproteobacteria bacterium]|nr:HAMP domain-containing histidine kinase [Deltaproteobacteria bacterium]
MIDNTQETLLRACSAYPYASGWTCIYIDILENIDLGLLLLDIEHESVVLQNKSAISILELNSKPMNYSEYKLLFLPDVQRSSITGDFGISQSLHYKDKLLGYTAYIIHNTFVWILIRDITEKARLESIAAEINTMDNIKYIFSGIRHELGNPINSIKMALSVLKTKLDTCSRDTITEYVDRILKEISRVEYLLKSLKSFGMFDNPNIQKINLSSFFNNFISLTAEDLQKKGIDLRIIPNADAQWILADPRALQHAILNLVTNASDALEESLNPTIKIGSEKRDDMIWIHVEDNGCGMSKEVCDNLFKPFYTTKPFGTGLGLTITKKMLTKMNGSIEINSIKNRGTRATMKLPEGHYEE